MKANQFSRYGKKIIFTAIAVCLLVFQSSSQQKGYAPVNGLKMYYEIYGTGKPLLLLHGAFNTIDMSFGMLIPELSKTRQVIAVELQGHGRTNDIDRPFSLEAFADDVAALLKYLKIDSADIMGYSMGGLTAWQVAIRHPEVVRKLIIISAVYKYEGWSPETRAIFPTLTAEMFTGSPIKTEYDKLAPDPGHWTQFINKMVKFVKTTFDFGADKIKAIKSPTLIISADGDGVMPEHAVEMFRLRGGGYMVDFGPAPKAQLAIFPGSSHISVMFQKDWLVSMITPFLDAK
ncbi:MAG TPA: alpha/beta hydrolase [Chitinophagaceae bacterium]|nr:alpha/beta hydrolase [Chitinophagaceae bacterium]